MNVLQLSICTVQEYIWTATLPDCPDQPLQRADDCSVKRNPVLCYVFCLIPDSRLGMEDYPTIQAGRIDGRV